MHSSGIYPYYFLLNIKNLDKNRANPSSIGLPGEGEIVHQKPFLEEHSLAIASIQGKSPMELYASI